MNEPAKPQRLECETCHTVADFPSKTRARKSGWIYGEAGRYCPACAVAERERMAVVAMERRQAEAAAEHRHWAQEIAEKEAYTIILEKRTLGLVFYDDAIDLTEQVVKAYDMMMK